MIYLQILIFLVGYLFSTTAQAVFYHMPEPGNDIIGHVFTVYVKKGDSINKFMRRYEVSYHELLEANPGIKPSRLHIGQPIVIPMQFILPKYRKGIIINTVELRLYYFTPDGQYVFTTIVGLGRDGWRTPTIKTRVIKKEEKPTWHVPKSIAEHVYKTTGKILPERILPGPKNPLGDYAIYLAKRGYLIHGTNNPGSVGKYYSSGCMRLSSDAIDILFHEVSIGTPVYLIHHANKAGWLNGELYLESHVPVSHNEGYNPLNYRDMENAIREATKNRPASINWYQADLITKTKTGIPKPIGQDPNYGKIHDGYDNGIHLN